MSSLKKQSFITLLAASAALLVTACDQHRSFEPIKPKAKAAQRDCRVQDCTSATNPADETTPSPRPNGDEPASGAEVADPQSFYTHPLNNPQKFYSNQDSEEPVVTVTTIANDEQLVDEELRMAQEQALLDKQKQAEADRISQQDKDQAEALIAQEDQRLEKAGQLAEENRIAEEARAAKANEPTEAEQALLKEEQRKEKALAELFLVGSSIKAEVKHEMSDLDATAIQALSVKIEKLEDKKYNVNVRAILDTGSNEGRLIYIDTEETVRPGVSFLNREARVAGQASEIILDSGDELNLFGTSFNPEAMTLAEALNAKPQFFQGETLNPVNLENVQSIISCSKDCENIIVHLQVNGESLESTRAALVVVGMENDFFYSSLGEAQKNISQRERELNQITKSAKDLLRQEIIEADEQYMKKIDEQNMKDLKLLMDEVDKVDRGKAEAEAEAERAELLRKAKEAHNLRNPVI